MKGVIQRAVEHYIKCKSDGMVKSGHMRWWGWGRWDTERERGRDRVQNKNSPKCGLGILMGLWKPSGSLKSRLFSLPLKMKTSHYLKKYRQGVFQRLHDVRSPLRQRHLHAYSSVLQNGLWWQAGGMTKFPNTNLIWPKYFHYLQQLSSVITAVIVLEYKFSLSLQRNIEKGTLCYSAMLVF